MTPIGKNLPILWKEIPGKKRNLTSAKTWVMITIDFAPILYYN